jgi:hypothetical protein
MYSTSIDHILALHDQGVCHDVDVRRSLLNILNTFFFFNTWDVEISLLSATGLSTPKSFPAAF